MTIDSRPSDALALALRVDCPIFVDEEVIKNSKQATNPVPAANSEELRKWLAEAVRGSKSPFAVEFQITRYKLQDYYSPHARFRPTAAAPIPCGIRAPDF